MLDFDTTKQSIQTLLAQIDDQDALILFEKSLQKLVSNEGNDLEKYQELKQEV